MSASDICDALKKGMTEITYDGLTGKSITWSEDGEPTKRSNRCCSTERRVSGTRAK